MPLYRRLPKRGFKSFGNKNKKTFAIINLSKIEENIKKNMISTSTKVDLSVLKKSNIIGKKYNKLKLLGTGDISKKFDIEVNAISNSAKSKIEKIGGKVTLIK